MPHPESEMERKDIYFPRAQRITRIQPSLSFVVRKSSSAAVAVPPIVEFFCSFLDAIFSLFPLSVRSLLCVASCMS